MRPIILPGSQTGAGSNYFPWHFQVPSFALVSKVIYALKSYKLVRERQTSRRLMQESGEHKRLLGPNGVNVRRVRVLAVIEDLVVRRDVEDRWIGLGCGQAFHRENLLPGLRIVHHRAQVDRQLL